MRTESVDRGGTLEHADIVALANAFNRGGQASETCSNDEYVNAGAGESANRLRLYAVYSHDCSMKVMIIGLLL